MAIDEFMDKVEYAVCQNEIDKYQVFTLMKQLVQKAMNPAAQKTTSNSQYKK